MVQKRIGFLAAAMLFGAAAIPSSAQPQPAQPAQPAQPGNAGGRGNGAQRYMDMMKQQLGLSDDEFKAIQPKMEAVMNARNSARGQGGFGGGRNRGGQNGGNAPADPNAPAPSAAAKASADLKTTLDNKDASADEIKAKLAALREARTAAKADLVKAQADLKEVLTQRQEAVLVNMGILE
jgi:Spy/CpxP family protein refolding chaperone